MIRPGSKCWQTLTVLRDGPATTGEVAAELGWRSHMAHAYLCKLEQSGRVTRERFPHCRVRYLWSVAEDRGA